MSGRDKNPQVSSLEQQQKGDMEQDQRELHHLMGCKRSPRTGVVQNQSALITMGRRHKGQQMGIHLQGPFGLSILPRVLESQGLSHESWRHFETSEKKLVKPDGSGFRHQGPGGLRSLMPLGRLSSPVLSSQKV